MPTTDLAIQSWCLRARESLADVITDLQASGVTAVELCRKHCDFDDPDAVEAAVAQLAAAGITVVSTGVEGISRPRAELATLFDQLARFGCGTVSIDAAPEADEATWQQAAELAAERGLRLAIHNHGKHHWLGNAATLRRILAATPATIGLCVDTAWALDAGEDPVAWIREFADRVYSVHLKDFTFDADGNGEDVVIGRSGNLDLEALMAAVAACPEEPHQIIEYEGDVDAPVPALAACVEAWAGVSA